MRRNLFAWVALLCMSTTAHALILDQPLPDPAQEARARAIFHELKCVVCEGQSLAESDATLAGQMRTHIRTMVANGESDATILAYFREHYGEKILMTPPVERSTLLLWLAPLLLIFIGALLVRRATRVKDPA